FVCNVSLTEGSRSRVSSAEAAHADDDYIAALRPMLATSNGSLIALSTPNGKRGWFYDQWHSCDDSWTRVCAARRASSSFRTPATSAPRSVFYQT
ncbi:MAG: hypothetical protein WB495_05490, partial [Xanthobacteraceae bacterium]